jgi:aspartate kinase
MALIIQKFGGTSLADENGRERLAGKVMQALDHGDQPVLVVSAIGRRGAPYATDTLLDILLDFDPKPDRMISDLLVSSGETISACLIATLLRQHGIQAVPLTAYTAGILGQGPFGDAVPVGVDSAAILAHLGQGMTPVITGFQAKDPSNNIITLGRGGSDTSAMAIGAGLLADFVDIYTDVPGVAKADPRVVQDVEYMEFLDYGSMFRLARCGAKVLQDRSAKLAENSGLLVRVRSTFDDGEGTLIGPAGTRDKRGRPRTHSDFIGLAWLPDPDGSLMVTAVFAKGKGKVGNAVAMAAAQPFQVVQNQLDDPDAVSFRCEPERLPGFAKCLYAGLEQFFSAKAIPAGKSS